MKIDVRDEYDRLTEVFRETAEILEWPDEMLFGGGKNPSQWSPAQHLYHLWLSSSKSLHAVAMIHHGHEAVRPEGEANEQGRAVLEAGRFPRGRMKAPENVQPPEELERATLEETLERSRAKLKEVGELLDELPDLPGRLAHPRLGVLTAPEWMRFIRIHAAHHLAIAREVAGREGDS